MISKMLKKFLEPFPIEERKWPLIIGISISVTIILLVFKPFGLINSKLPNTNLIIAGYGLVTFIILIINLFLIENLFPRVFSDSNWTVLGEIIWILWIIITIGTANIFYTHYFFKVPPMEFRFFILFILFTLAIGIIPVTFMILLKQNRQLKKYVLLADQLNAGLSDHQPGTEESKDIISLYSERKQQKFEINANKIITIVSDGNYVTIYFESTGNMDKQILRNTHQDIAKQCSDVPFLFKCHRAYIINLNKIEKARGNSQGYKLTLQNFDQEIIVSRSYAKEFKSRLNF